MHRWTRVSISCLVVAAAFASRSIAQAPKRPLTAQDFDSWKSISGTAISHDGHYLAYGLFPQEGDGEVVIRDLKSGKEWREPAGQLPPPPVPDPSAEEAPPPRAIRLVFTNDSKTLVFLAYAKRETVEKAKTDKQLRAQEELVVVDLAGTKATRTPDVKNFQTPEKADGFVAYQKYGPVRTPANAPGAPSADDVEEDQARGGGRAAAAGGSNAEFGSVVVLRTLADGSERQFPDVLEFQLARNGKVLAYSVASSKAEMDGVFTVATTGGETHDLISGKGRYQHLAWDEKVNELAFIGNPGEADGAKKPPYKLFLWKAGEVKAAEIVTTATAGFRNGYVVNDHAALTFSKDGNRLFFGAAPPPPPEHATAIDEDKPSYDLWNYKDDYLPTIQKSRATAELNRSFRAVYLVPQKKMLQLADDSMPELTPNEQARYGLGTYDKEYRPMQDYGERVADYYLVDMEDGHRTLLAKKHEGRMSWSGDGKYVVYFDGKDWNTTSVAGGKSVNLTAGLPVKFWNQENDTPSTPPAYGIAGWTKDDKYVLLYDHFDIWQLAPNGSSAVNLTRGLGRREHMELRYLKLDSEERTIDPAKPLILRAEDITTRNTGFYTTTIGAKDAPTQLMMQAKDLLPPIKAKDADIYVVREETFSQYPDLMISDGTFKNLKKVSDQGAQMDAFLWGTDEMVNFENIDGAKLQGILYKPANFNPAKKYPMIVYLYEKLSQNLNLFVEPRPMDSINISYYVSNGYLVFTPDIVYQTGYPGQSALKCVMAGVNAVTIEGFVDESNIGIQGHSWGGYQIAYMVTQTNRFKAAEDGAPVANMISAYDGIRWGSGIPRQFQYEHTQSRIGGNPWQYPLRFIENSPIFMVDKIQTPLLIIANDADDAVPWYQGIEFFLALRRLGKEAYMYTYNGEPHHLRRRPNQKDYAIRMAQFFDFELKGGSKPAWMEKGVPYLHTPEQFAPGN